MVCPGAFGGGRGASRPPAQRAPEGRGSEAGQGGHGMAGPLGFPMLGMQHVEVVQAVLRRSGCSTHLQVKPTAC